MLSLEEVDKYLDNDGDYQNKNCLASIAKGIEQDWVEFCPLMLFLKMLLKSFKPAGRLFMEHMTVVFPEYTSVSSQDEKRLLKMLLFYCIDVSVCRLFGADEIFWIHGLNGMYSIGG